MTVMLNYQVQDGRDNNSHPTLDEIRSQYGSGVNAGSVNAQQSAYAVTIPAGKVFHVRSLIVSMNATHGAAATAQMVLSVTRSATSTTEMLRLRFIASDVQNAKTWETATKIDGFVIVASTVTPAYIRVTAVHHTGSIFIGGILRDRVAQDTTT